MRDHKSIVIVALGSTQTLAWASSYYLPAVIAEPMARDIGLSPNWIYGAFSASVLLSGIIGPNVGRRIDRVGGRDVLALSNLLFAGGLAVLSLAHGLAGLALAWMVLGLAMGLGLYDAAFATLGRLYGTSARSAITGIALMAGFASTLGWPLTTYGIATIGWRETCLAWAAAHLIVALPINRLLVPSPPSASPDLPLATTAAVGAASQPSIAMDRNMWLLGIALACVWFVATAMASHLPKLLELSGSTPAQAIAAASLMGPAQVAARLVEAGWLRAFHPLVSARLAAMAHPAAVVAFYAGGAVFAPVFGVMHGAGNGILTIARGTVPLAIYGPQNYGYRLGLLGAPARIAQALAPLVFGLVMEHAGAGALVVSGALGLVTFAAFSLVTPAGEHGTAPAT